MGIESPLMTIVQVREAIFLALRPGSDGQQKDAPIPERMTDHRDVT